MDEYILISMAVCVTKDLQTYSCELSDVVRARTKAAVATTIRLADTPGDVYPGPRVTESAFSHYSSYT